MKASVNIEKRAEELRGFRQEALRALAEEREQLAEERKAFLLEKAEAEEREKFGGGEDTGKKVKGKGRRKGKDTESKGPDALTSFLSPSTSQVQNAGSTAAHPETPTAAQRAIARRAPPPPVDDGEDDEEDSDSSSVAGRPLDRPKTEGWFSGSEDEGERRSRPRDSRPLDSRRATGSGPRFVDNLPPRFRALQEQQQL